MGLPNIIECSASQVVWAATCWHLPSALWPTFSPKANHAGAIEVGASVAPIVFYGNVDATCVHPGDVGVCGCWTQRSTQTAQSWIPSITEGAVTVDKRKDTGLSSFSLRCLDKNGIY